MGAVHSIVLSGRDRSRCHRDVFGYHFKEWRYDASENQINKSPFATDFDDEDYDKIRNHLERKYALKSWLNENYYY